MTKDREVFWQLLEPEYRRANMFCRKLAGDRERGDDLFQDGLVAGLAKFTDLRDRSAFRPWLYRILINTYRGRTRRPWWRKETPLTAADAVDLTGDDPTDRYTARRILERGLQVLSADDRALLVLHELEGWPIRDLAELHGRSENATAARLFRIRNRVKKALENLPSVPDRKSGSKELSGKESEWTAAKPKND